MNNFYSYNPTKIIFGQGMLKNIAREIPEHSRILVLYGGGSIKKNTLYKQLQEALENYQWEEFSGIRPNPEYQQCMQVLDYVKVNNIDFLLAVGGGSVIDASKFVALAYYYNKSKDPWDFVTQKQAAPERSLPLGCVLTIPATGSEMNNGFVISRREFQEKIPCSSYVSFPLFSVLDPEFTYSLSAEQTANGIVDIFVHVLEQYITYPTQATLQERQAEAILHTLVETAPKLLANLHSYPLRATIMWCATQALNGNLGRGVPSDWATHDIGHQLTALFGLTHAQTLAIVLPGVYHNQLEVKKDKLIQYGQRIWQLDKTNNTAQQAIEKTLEFFHQLGVKTKLSDYHLDIDEVLKTAMPHFRKKGIAQLGEHKKIGLDDIERILYSRR